MQRAAGTSEREVGRESRSVVLWHERRKGEEGNNESESESEREEKEKRDRCS